MRNEVITLITQGAEVYDDDGFLSTSTEARVTCFAQVKSATYKEYYSAENVGEKVTDIFVVGEQDYKLSMQTIAGKKLKPSLVEYDGTQYKIIRRYRQANKSDYVIELSCVEVESNG